MTQGPSFNLEDKVDNCLRFIGVDPEGRSYRNQNKLLTLYSKHSGESIDRQKKLARCNVGIDRRYINDYTDGFIEWGIIQVRDGRGFFVGVPREGQVLQIEPISVEDQLKQMSLTEREAYEQFKKSRKS